MRVERRGDFIDIDIGGNIEHVLKVAEALKLAKWITELVKEEPTAKLYVDGGRWGSRWTDGRHGRE